MTLKNNKLMLIFFRLKKYGKNVIKPSFIACLSVLIHLSANAYGQQNISISASDVGLVEVMNQIENKSDYKFLYQNDIIPVGKKITINAQNEDVVEVLNKIKPPYNINQATQELALMALDNVEEVNSMIKEAVQEREILAKHLAMLPFVQVIFPSDANFLLVKMEEANTMYTYLKSKGIIVRNRSNVLLCDDSLRITIGTPQENNRLIKTLQEYKTS